MPGYEVPLKIKLEKIKSIEQENEIIKSHYELGIVRSFNFSSNLQRMSVIVKNPNDNFYLICGTDVYVDIPNWYLGKEVIEQVDFIVYPRNSSTVYSPESMKGKTTWLEGVPTLEISSTFIRNQIKNKKSTEYILPAEVKEFIIFNNLYQ
jgi:nicotinate (nicotinamide) nucleotide adenylyltransferase